MGDVTGVLAMVHGSASGLDEGSLADYLGRVMRGRSPSDDQVADLRSRYELIGGPGHLMEASRRQAEQLGGVFGDSYRVVLGAKHSVPFVKDALHELAAAGVRRAVGIALAPHESALTTSQYDGAGSEAAAELGLEWTMVRSWHLEAPLISLWADLVSAAVGSSPAATRVLFSAHSLPIRAGDPYPDQVSETADAVSRVAGLDRSEWQVVYQSVPPDVDPATWLGPNLAESYPPGSPAVVAPIGFVSEHLEVLYDIDVQAREEAAAVGCTLTRTALPSDDVRLARAMANAISAIA